MDIDSSYKYSKIELKTKDSFGNINLKLFFNAKMLINGDFMIIEEEKEENKVWGLVLNLSTIIEYQVYK